MTRSSTAHHPAQHVLPADRVAPSPRPKVFGIGFHKTGTTSLAVALQTLGYDVCGYFGNDDPDIADTALSTAYSKADRFDAAQDMPWPVLFRELDERYPGSKFILTVRPSDAWFESVERHFKRHRIASHEWIYGVPTAAGFRQAYVDRYERHNAEVIHHFADRPDDLLVIDLAQDRGWTTLCTFLDVPEPSLEFPVQNTARQKADALPQRIVAALGRRLLLGRTAPSPDVSSDVVRSMIQRHFRRFDDVIDSLAAISPSVEADAQSSLETAFGLIRDQVSHELDIAARFGADETLDSTIPDDSLPALIEYRRRVVTALRGFAAGLDDQSASDVTTDTGTPIWQVVVDLHDESVERYTRLRFAVAAIDLTGRSFDERRQLDAS